MDATDSSFDINASSRFCFPSDYDDEFFLGVAGRAVTGGVYRVTPGTAYRCALNADVISLGVVGRTGNTRLMAGSQDNATVYYSSDDGESWEEPDKVASGGNITAVLLASDFTASGVAYAASSGADSAFSLTADHGTTWNQISLIDTTISNILDLSPSPDYEQDGTLFLLAWGGEFSLWRTSDDAQSWERVFSSGLPGISSLNRVALSPEYSAENQTLFLAGSVTAGAAIWKSVDNGQNFAQRSAPTTIDAWAIADGSTVFLGGYDGVHGLVYHSINSGQRFNSGAVVSDNSLSYIALSPSFDTDETVLVGDSVGGVYLSSDGGDSFESLPADSAAAPCTGAVSVAFDPDFAQNQTVYAASDTAGEGVYRFVIGESEEWENIDAPAASVIKEIALPASGVLYAANARADSGVRRCLTPTYSGTTFEALIEGLETGATLVRIRLAGERLWVIDSTNIELLSLSDTLSGAVELLSPDDEAPGIGTISNGEVKGIKLDWETLKGATSYDWQLDDDSDFSDALHEDNSDSSYVNLPALDIATTYYWRVRAAAPVLSPWSDKWSFTTGLGEEVNAPRLLYPDAGAMEVPLRPILQWSSFSGASNYELVISTDPAIGNPTILKSGEYALRGTAWQCNIDLNPGTTYYWKVRAVNGKTYSAWSSTSAFVTAQAVVETPSSTPTPVAAPVTPSIPPSTPQVSPFTDVPDWVIYLVGGLVLMVILLLVTVMVLIVTLRR